MWQVCSEIWDSDSWPDDWCKSIVITVAKKGERTECSTHRTTALTSHAGKIMQNFILFTVKGVITENLSDEKGGCSMF
jgi:hypothetical protein